MNLFTKFSNLKRNLLLIFLSLSSSLAFAQMSAYCEAVTTHFNIPGEVASTIMLTIANIDANTMYVEIESADGDPVDLLFIPIVSGGGMISPENTVVPGKISRTFTWAGIPPANVTFNVLWSKASFGGNWQLSPGDITVPFAATCPFPPPPPPATPSFCNVEITHFGIPAETASAINLTIVNTTANTVKIEIESTTADPVDFLLINGGSGATISAEDFSVPGKISRTLTWGVPPPMVTLNMLWSKETFGGNWQLSPGDITVPFSLSCTASCSDLFFSEYIEGSSFDKAIEIYNPTGATIDLAAENYVLSLFQNGSASVSQFLALTGSIASGDVLVLSHGSANAAILAAADLTNNSVINFNGDDAVVLTKGGQYGTGSVVDAIGKVGEDPGSQWSNGGVGTQNENLRRMATVSDGDPFESNDFFPDAEWISFDDADYSNFGNYMNDCIVPLCTIDDIVVDAIGACDDKGTPDPTDDEFSLEFTVEYTGAPASGNLDVEVNLGGATNVANASVAIADLDSGSTHTFTVNVPSLGGSISISAEFSDDMSCSSTETNLGDAPVACSINPCGELFFSEYIEGSGVNKCVEIYNPTAGPIDLGAGDYEFHIYFNGNSAAAVNLDLSGTIAAGDVYVICDDGAAAEFLAEADLTPGNSFFNGDDAITLTKSGYTIDALGQIGFDPGSQWGTGVNSTQNNTILKRIDIQQGDTNPFDAFDPATEWLGFQQNYSDDLGSHCGSCNAMNGTPCDAGFEFVDPCACLDNASTVPNGSNGDDGQFSETIVLRGAGGGPLPNGINFTVGSATNAFDAFDIPPVGVQSLGVPVAAGTTFQYDAVDESYFMDFVHRDGAGYNMSIQANGATIGTIGNTCYYPNPIITNIDSDFCLNSPAFALEGNAGGVAGTGQFFVDGVAAVNFDPAAAGIGTYQVLYVFDADTALGYELIDGAPAGGAATLADAQADPGCEQSVLGTINVVETPSTLVCNDNVQISLDENCEAWVTPDMILEGEILCDDDYFVEMTINPGIPVPNPLTGAYIGDDIIVTVTHLVSGNSCWGSITLEDKLVVPFICPPTTIPCTQEVNSVPFPTYDDNCTVSIVAQLTGEGYIDEDVCDDNQAIWFRTFVAVDAQGNVSEECTQLITIVRPTIIDFPDNIEWTCNEYATFPNIIGATPLTPFLPTTGSGIPLDFDGALCNYSVTHSDIVLPTCGYAASTDSPVFKIVRTWTVLDWCTGNVIIDGNGDGDGTEDPITDPDPLDDDNVQIIKVIDVTPPALAADNITAAINIAGEHPQPCLSTGFIQVVGFVDCTDIADLQIFTPIGEATYLNNNPFLGGFIPDPGLALGNYIVTYIVTDNCGNVAELDVDLEVVDNTAPAAICDEITEINISSDGLAVVPASVFDDGSNDNCCLDNFTVRRMDTNCGVADDTAFGDYVTFCCEDVDQNPITVVFRATDCSDNSNDCMVLVYVNDKILPHINCPADATINCDEYLTVYETALSEGDYSVLSVFGSAVAWDNCEAIVASEVTVEINQCAEGTIEREWSVNDPSDNGPNGSINCSQIITVDHVSNWAVMFPDDLFVDCGVDVPEFGEPTLYFESCELIAVSYEDELYTNVPDACYKLVRQWTVINWCTVGNDIDQEVVELSECDANIDYNGNGINCAINNPLDDPAFIVGHSHRTFREDLNTPDGYITYQQVIKVNDTVVPLFVDCSIPDMCIYDGCSMTVNIPQPTVTDCSSEITITVESTDLPNGTGFGPYANVGVGTYTVVYKATDNCGNFSVCETSFSLADCKNPTPYCVEGLIIGIMNTSPPMVDVWASDFDAGSFDNCGVQAISFSADVTDDQIVFDCDDLGEQVVQLWVTDIYGNQDFCETFVVIQNNMGFLCDDELIVSGNIATETNDDVSDVDVQVNSDVFTQNFLTGNDGMYTVNVPAGGDYSITPAKDINPLNGVTTFDLVQITKHILNVNLLDSPYQMIAADVNKSNSVTSFDLVQLRKLILFIDADFANNTSWRFVPQGYEFSNPANPFAEEFPEIINLNNISSSSLASDFVAIKIGDVNGSANANNLLGTDDRTVNGALIFTTADIALKVGETYEVAVSAKNFNNYGYQFTLDFNGLELMEIKDGIAKEENFGKALLSENVLTASYSAGQAVELSKEETVFTFVFKSTVNANLSDVLAINSKYTSAEAYSSNGDLQNVNLEFNGATTVSNKFELYQNTPNPFAENTKIGFNLPTATKATITISDVSGRVLTVIEKDFAKGHNSIELNKKDLPTAGVLYYQLATDSHSATMKMILTK